MKKVVKTYEYEYYTFDELKDNIKEELIEKENRNNVDSYCEFELEEDMKYKCEELLTEIFGKSIFKYTLEYDFSYSQSSGVWVQLEIKNISLLNDKFKIFDEKFEDNIIYFKYNLYHTNYGYRVDFDYNYQDEEDINYNSKDTKNIELGKEMKKLENFIHSDLEDKIKELNNVLYKYGYSLLEYNFTNDSVETLKQYYYLKNGTQMEEIGDE